MKRKVKPVPKGYHTVTPYLLIKGVDKLLKFLAKAFDAKVVDRMEGPGGAVMHASVKIGDSMVMMGEAHGQWKPIPAMIYLYVKDADAAYKSALRAGAVSVMKPADQFWGDRHGGVQDFCGNQWWMSTHIEDLSKAETRRRGEEYMKKMKAAQS
ncbi:MAG TPA: VOC family protein [Candidatus Dormibacteraeota bacterium]|nr:VOC family protein [Candidatus Dormibacteraeota bacterium]